MISTFALIAPSAYCADESPTRVVRKIEWSGLEHLSEEELEAAILTTAKSWKPWEEGTAFDRGTFEQDLERLRRFYRRKGFYGARLVSEVDESHEGEVVLRLFVEEGTQATLEDLSFSLVHPGASHAPLDESQLRDGLTLAPGSAFSADQYQQTKNTLKQTLAQFGYPVPSISGGAEVDVEKNTVHVRWRVEPGPYVRMGEPTLTGIDRVAADLVLGELQWKPGDAYDPKQIRQTQRAIFDLGLFRSVTIEPKRSKALAGETAGEEVWPFEIRVRERPPRSVRASLGYGTEDQARGRLEWRHRNLLGGLRDLRIGGKYSFLVRGFEGVLVQPRFITRRTTLTLDTIFEEETRPAYSTRGLSAGWQLKRPLVGNWRGRFGHRVDFRKVTGVSANAPAAQSDEDESFRLLFFEIGATYSSVDSEIDPSRGTWFDLSVEPSLNQLGSDVSYVKSVADVRHFIPVLGRVVLASRLRLGGLEAIAGNDSLDIPVFKRLFAGGSTSVRGFNLDQLGQLAPDEDPVGGLTSAEASVELRFPIWRKLGGVGFVDGGQVALDSFELKKDDFYYSAGGGIRYSTPIGPLRLDFAQLLNAPDGLADFRVHFSIGQAF